MKKVILLSLLLFIFFGCTKTENGLVFGTPDYEKRSILVTQTDLNILQKTDEILNKEKAWKKNSIRVCKDSLKLSLYCALEKASIEIMGKYVHRQPALQEIRFIIDDYYKDRWKIHRLADFNAHSETSFEDVKSVINKAIETVKTKLAKTSNK